jgi:hypothetical protein
MTGRNGAKWVVARCYQTSPFFLTKFIHKMQYLILAPLFFICSAAFSAESGRPTGENCSLIRPPAGAGEEMNHGVTLRVYPRAIEISKQYSGCQTIWTPSGEKWEVVSIVAIEAGDPVRVWSPAIPPPPGTECRFKKGQVVKGDSNHCPQANHLILKSLTPGCVEKVRKAVAAGGLGIKMADACYVYE